MSNPGVVVIWIIRSSWCSNSGDVVASPSTSSIDAACSNSRPRRWTRIVLRRAMVTVWPPISTGTPMRIGVGRGARRAGVGRGGAGVASSVKSK